MQLVAAARGSGPEFWTGAPSAVLDGDTIALAWRERRSADTDEFGRGSDVVFGRSRDGVIVEELARISMTEFGAGMFDRPALVRLPDGGWRAYLSCASPDLTHWWVDSVSADSLATLAEGERRVIHDGDGLVAVKDPVVLVDQTGEQQSWRMYLTHLTAFGPGGRMTTHLLTGDDGLAWTDGGEVLSGATCPWCAQGARLTALLPDGSALFDGQPDPDPDGPGESTRRARWDGSRFLPVDNMSASAGGAWRFASVVPLPGGTTRLYAEVVRPDGAHDLMTGLMQTGLID